MSLRLGMEIQEAREQEEATMSHSIVVIEITNV
jgi:hypothetical protein